MASTLAIYCFFHHHHTNFIQIGWAIRHTFITGPRIILSAFLFFTRTHCLNPIWQRAHGSLALSSHSVVILCLWLYHSLKRWHQTINSYLSLFVVFKKIRIKGLLDNTFCDIFHPKQGIGYYWIWALRVVLC